MAERQFGELFVRLYADPALRKRFAESPENVLREEGLDPDLLALPKKIDPVALEEQLKKIFQDRSESLTSDAATVAKLSPDELWQRFKVIGLSPDARAFVGADDPGVAAAVVIYGVSMVTSGSSTQVTVAASGRGVQAIRSMAELKQLRDLARRPAGELAFSISGPDGVTVTGLTKDVVEAFLSRVK